MKIRIPAAGAAAVLALAAIGTGTIGTAATAQDAGASAQAEILDGAQDWHPFSRSAARVYMADVKSIAANGDVTRVTIAKAPLAGAAGDYAHAEETVEFKCAIKQSRSVSEAEFGADGNPADRYNDASDWEAYGENSRDGFLAGLVCDGDRANPPTWPSIKAWVDGGRK